jgi:hypothetical protein
MTLLLNLGNCNLSTGLGSAAKTYTATQPGLYLFVANNGYKNDHSLQFIFMVFFGSSSSNVVQTFNNPSSRWTLGTSNVAASITLWNSGYSSSYTSFYLYGVRLF